MSGQHFLSAGFLPVSEGSCASGEHGGRDPGEGRHRGQGARGQCDPVGGLCAGPAFPMDNITDFLYLIGSVFAPMIAVQIADFYILQRDRADRAVDVRGLLLWAVGFAAYRGLMMVDLPLGSTIPDIALTVVLCVVVDKLTAKTKA